MSVARDYSWSAPRVCSDGTYYLDRICASLETSHNLYLKSMRIIKKYPIEVIVIHCNAYFDTDNYYLGSSYRAESGLAL